MIVRPKLVRWWRVALAASITVCAFCCSRSVGAEEPRAPASPVAQADVPPKVIHGVKAEYPPEAAASEREADVVIMATVSKNGDVTAVEVDQHGGDPFDDAALDAARQWKFVPAMRDGKPIESRVRIPFHFRHGPPPPTPPTPAPTAPPTPPVAPPTPLSTPPQTPAEAAPAPVAPAPLPVAPEAVRSYESNVAGRIKAPPSRGASDYHVDVGALSLVPRNNASEFLKLAPGILLTNEGGEGHAEQVFLRGFDAREGQDIEFSVDGIPINESGNLHGSGYADTHFIIPELIESLRVVEGPFDPRQGNYAVAGSADYHLGLADRGMTAKFSLGNYGTYRLLLMYGPPHASDGTFAAAEIYQTDGFGQNRDGRRGSAMAQWEGGSGATHYRLFGQAYIASFHTAGVIRDDDYRAGRIGFYDTYDPRQGEDASRYSVSFDISHKSGHITADNLVYGIVRPIRLRENFTGFLLDTQDPLQPPHGQRGDLIDLDVMDGTVGLRGYARLSGMLLRQLQEIEIGYFARGDFGSGVQQRLQANAAANPPYHTDTNLDYRLGDLGLYLDVNLKPLRWLAVRGGVRGDIFTYDVHNNCAVQSVEHPDPTRPLDGQSCLDEQNFGAHREPDQRASTQSAAYMPRGSVLIGPFWGLGATASVGQGVRSIDPIYITQDAKTPFASTTAYEAGLTFSRRFAETIDLSASSVFFDTKVDHDLIFSQTVGRNTLAGATTRLGSASTLRLTGPFYDLGANLTYVRATFDDTKLLVPYVPDLVLRVDTALFATLPWRWARWREKPLFASLALGVTYVGPRPLPYGVRSDTIATVDASATLRWWLFEVDASVQNLFDTKYRLGEYNYASDFHSQPFPTLVPVRHFTAGAPLTFLVSFAIHYGDRR
ncbi:MAG: TonB family protein / TonB-dependent receptor [bacterium]|nr:TonB family protein / TonB-dependent receptor [bacterium]